MPLLYYCHSWHNKNKNTKKLQNEYEKRKIPNSSENPCIRRIYVNNGWNLLFFLLLLKLEKNVKIENTNDVDVEVLPVFISWHLTHCKMILCLWIQLQKIIWKPKRNYSYGDFVLVNEEVHIRMYMWCWIRKSDMNMNICWVRKLYQLLANERRGGAIKSNTMNMKKIKKKINQTLNFCIAK